MRATTTILFIAGFIGAAYASADTIQFSDEDCNDEIKEARKGFSFVFTGDVPIVSGAKSIKVTSFADTWYAFQANDGESCRGDLITKIEEGPCIKTADLGIGCTRLCGGGMGGEDCASNQEPL